MNDRQIAYTLILGRPLDTFSGTSYAFYVYTDDDPLFERVHVTGDIAAMLDFVCEYVQEDVMVELKDDPFFWESVSSEIAKIADPALRAFAQYALGGIVAPIYTLDEAYYLRGVLSDQPGTRFVMGWEAQPPLHDVAYCILERNDELND